MIEEVYRFGKMTNPTDSPVVYAISSNVEDLKEVLIDGYEAYAENVSPTY